MKNKQFDEEEKPHELTRKKLRSYKEPAPTIVTFQDLIHLCNHKDLHRFLDCQLLIKIKPILIELNNMVGIQNIKNELVKFVLFQCQSEHYLENSMNHVIITGSSGTGKSMLAEILAKLYSATGKLNSNEVIKANLTSLTGQYIGWSEAQTQKLIDKAVKKNCTLLIDEAYAIGDTNNDGFGRKIIDTLVYNLNDKDKGHKFVCFLVGYKAEMEKYILGTNPGLQRRFPWRFDLSDYTSEDLKNMLQKKIQMEDLEIDFDLDKSCFELKYFPKFGGSILIFFQKLKLELAFNSFGKVLKHVITKKIFLSCLEDYKKSFVIDENKYLSMYM